MQDDVTMFLVMLGASALEMLLVVRISDKVLVRMCRREQERLERKKAKLDEKLTNKSRGRKLRTYPDGRKEVIL